jgi:hypothetical protein
MGRITASIATILFSAVASTHGLAQGTGAADADKAASAAMFKQIAEVLRHPRCLNCHTVTEFPRQGDSRSRHQQLVMRGPEGRGIPPMQCSNCHQDHNSPDGKIPGAHNWHLAPLSMGWEHLKTDKALCEAFLDRKLNHERDPAALARHVGTDPLVLWAWMPGARKPAPGTHKQFHELVSRWAASGAACPAD